jgi:hypothetical protein
MTWSRRKLRGWCGNDLIVQQHRDAFGMGAHRHHAARGARIDAVAIVIGQIRHVVAALTAFSTKPSNGPRNSIRLPRSSWKTSQMVRSLNSGCRVRLA